MKEINQIDMGAEMDLTAKQKRFCEEYVIDFNGTRAAIEAGYSEKTATEMASENLTKPNIQAYLKELQADTQNQLGIDKVWVAQRFKEISDRCMQAEEVVDKNGEGTGEYKFDAAGANKATEMLGKHIGFFEIDNSQKGVAGVTIFQLPDNGRK